MPYGVARKVVNAGLAAALALCGLAVPADAADPVRILAFGDSLIAGYGLAAENAFPARLEAALEAESHDVEVIPAGVSGETTAGGLSRLEWLLADEPDAVILELGANDGLRGIEPESSRANLDKMLEILASRDIPVLFAGMRAPPNFGREYQEAFDRIFPGLAEEHDVIFYPFFLKGVATEPSLNQEDRIHPNPEGVDVIVENILPYAEELVARARENG